MSQPILGLIAGDGKFPFVFAREASKQGYRVVVGGVKGDVSIFLKFFVDKFNIFEVVDLKKMAEYFQSHGVNQMIMAGKVNSDHLFQDNVPWDQDLKALFAALKDRKTDTIFSAVAEAFLKYDIKLLDSTFLIKPYLAERGTLTRVAPSRTQLDDIDFGRGIAKDMGRIDIGQTVVIKDRAILAIEAMEGTDAAILRGGRIARRGATVVKMSKPNQDFRFDVPVIGPKTIRNMNAIHATCLAIEAGKTIVIDADKTVKLANRHNICIISC